MTRNQQTNILLPPPVVCPSQDIHSCLMTLSADMSCSSHKQPHKSRRPHSTPCNTSLSSYTTLPPAAAAALLPLLLPLLLRPLVFIRLNTTPRSTHLYPLLSLNLATSFAAWLRADSSALALPLPPTPKLAALPLLLSSVVAASCCFAAWRLLSGSMLRAAPASNSRTM